MRSCRDVARLLSESLDHTLPWHVRVGLRMHLAMCGICRVSRRQTLALRKALRCYGREDDPGEDTLVELPPEARERIRQRVREAAQRDRSASR